MKVLLSASLFVLASACATGVASDDAPLIMSTRVPQLVRQAATCAAFNENAAKHLFGVQLTTNDYADDGRFWRGQFEKTEPDAAARGRLMTSAVAKMEADFPRKAATPGVEVFNSGYATVVGACDSARKSIEADNG